MNEQDRLLHSIRAALWTLVVLVGITAIGLGVFFGVGTYCWVQDDDDGVYTIVAASTNIPAGGIMTKQNLGKKRVRKADLPKHYACPHTAYVLPGHKVLEELNRGDPIVLSKTDLWIRNEEEEPQPQD
jgi:flagella basal body P-ring formation protein FlgA